MDYQISKIPKSRTSFRTIYKISESDKNILRMALPYLEDRMTSLDSNDLNYAFLKNKNCSLHAFQHIGYQYTLSLDIENFFDSVKKEHVSSVLHQNIIDLCFINGAPRQGLPTSPIISSIAFLPCDSLILKTLYSLRIEAKYTRYADDLIFSFNNKNYSGKITTLVKQIIEEFGFKLNVRKTKLQNSRNGRRIITGIGVDNHGLHATRKSIKKLRAAIHQENSPSSEGLSEWVKCKLPKSLYSN